MKNNWYKLFTNYMFIIKESSKTVKIITPILLLKILSSVLKTWGFIYFTSNLLNALIQERINLTIIIFWLVILIVISMVENILSNRYNIYLKKVNHNLERNLYYKLVTIKYSKLDDNCILEKYEMARKMLEECGIDNINNQLISVFTNVINIIGVCYIVTKINFYLICLMMTILIINSVCENKRLSFVFKQNEDISNIELNMYYARDYLTSNKFAKDIRTYSLLDYVTKKIDYYINKLFKIQIKCDHEFIKKYWWTYVLNGILIFSAYFYIGKLYVNNLIDIGKLSLYISAILLLNISLVELMKNLLKIINQSKHIESYNNFLNEENDLQTDGVLSSAIERDIEIYFDHVWFRYSEDSDYILKDITFRCKTNDIISIVGQNGAGKSTIIKLLMHLYIPTKGDIYINNINIKNIGINEISNIISVVFQDYNIYSFTIAENIAMSNYINKEKIDNVLKNIHLDEVLNRKAANINSYITERISPEGINFSGGENQKIALARAIYKHSSIIILDEPTATLSPNNEAMLYKDYIKLMSNNISIFISHRLASCRLANKILVLDNGELVEVGNHDKLMKNKRLYYTMFKAQAHNYSEEMEEKL